jgi:2-polyprenyl-6-hydroxyphenyl methylase/3-demethylubiquinone-9 3-methyltransferase
MIATSQPGEPAPIRFRFGENWQSFVRTVDEAAIAEAEQGLLRLFPEGEIRGSRFLDIGCGSGLSALAACRLGAEAVDAVDLDPQSVAATTALLGAFHPQGGWSVRQQSVFDLTAAKGGLYDIVYSWGVLHHTGHMGRAIDAAAAMAGPAGQLAIALYRRTPLCPLWRFEKRFYAHAGPVAQAVVRGLYKLVYRAGLAATGRNPARYIAGYKSARGMDWHHDVHDWLGGYPYESTDPTVVGAQLARLGFTLRRVFEHKAAALGFFGSHCDEYVAVREAAR